MMRVFSVFAAVLATVLWGAGGAAATEAAQPPNTVSGLQLRAVFERTVAPRWQLPEDEQARYPGLINAALAQAGIALSRAQYLLAVDPNAQVQAALLYWSDAQGTLHWVGATPASTGRPGGFEYFLTPLGVFVHGTTPSDFRAEGTRNEFGIRGYGIKGMRVFDFGWVLAERTWDTKGPSPMRLQVHATDPSTLEPRLGVAASKGCIRIPATLNVLLDLYG